MQYHATGFHHHHCSHHSADLQRLARIFVKSELAKLKKDDDATLVEWLKSMQSTIEHTNKTLNEAMRGSTVEMTRTLQSNSRQLNERLDEAARVIGALNKNVGEMSEVGRGIKSLAGIFTVAETPRKYR